MKILKLAIIVLAIFVGVGTVNAASYTFDGGWALSNLVSWRNYEWGINLDLPAGEQITSATLHFDNFWEASFNDTLYVHLLEDATPGVSYSGWDWDSNADSFAGQGILLTQLEDVPIWANDYTYDFDLSEIAALMAFSSDGNFGIGFDPDCGYHGQISMDIETSPVPIPSAMLLLGSGLLGLVRLRKRNNG